MNLLVLKSVAEARAWASSARVRGHRVGLVPTMGFLHEGHLSLMRAAGARAEAVAASIFVNPAQFGPNEDLARYPRDLDGDLEKCERAGVHVAFVPDVQQMYPPGAQTDVEVSELSQGLCGARRPGHFRGVATVVAKFFSVFQPHVALFGEKDFQQLQVIRKMARDLLFEVDVVGMPIIRESDGLAMSSRNSYLSAVERERARALFRGLSRAREQARQGERAGAALCETVRAELRAAEVQEDYVELVEPEGLSTVAALEPGRPARLLTAGFVGKTRLIDNLELELGR